ncbi:MAG: hypothetical protein HW380_3973 [Magnetococcales bacterium]|nr:hypothetical protein [Magnetococcales bacterium]
MNLILRLRSAFRALSLTVPSAEAVKAREKQYTHNLVARYGKGNVNLQMGRFITESDALELKRQALEIKL